MHGTTIRFIVYTKVSEKHAAAIRRAVKEVSKGTLKWVPVRLLLSIQLDHVTFYM